MLAFLARTFASKKSQKGLYHAKDIRTGYSYTFSHKATKRTWKPNVHTKKLWSTTLNRMLELPVTIEALRVIRKKGGVDNYLLNTEPQQVRSKFGDLLRSYIEKKKEDPSWPVPYIPGTRKARKTLRSKEEYKNTVIWRPLELRNKDMSMEMFNRYDPNAPIRPDYFKEKNIKEKLAQSEISKTTMKEKKFEYLSGNLLKDITDGISKQLELDAISNNREDKLKDPKSRENKFLKRFKAKTSGK
ncbi:hypothetical protein SteCoe_7423 [Stentor coeruleus]|uniref:Large ribosomal subunit protein bL28m n=1 Tax=Stentor coeruleus TaxID=5963 RepID=A0A1R2CMN1_9CILI|nr:hypothetical protein SteCoe_7423 [Stentor coeruleus]